MVEANKHSKATEVLPPELLSHISQFLLANDVVDYINFRAVCREWRSCTVSPQGLDSCYRPRHWIMLPDGDANLYTASHRRFLNLSTGQSLLLHLPELDTHYLFSDSDGLLVLVHKVTHLVRLFNPFTRHLADLPHLPTETVFNGICCTINMFMSSISSGSCPTFVFLSFGDEDAYYAKPGDSNWGVLAFQRYSESILFFKDRFYFADPINGIQYVELDKKLFTTLIPPLVPPPPGDYEPSCDECSLAEYNSELLLVYRKSSSSDGGFLNREDHIFSVFRVDLESNRLVSFSNASDLSIFLGDWSRCLALSSKCLPSIKGNSIYYCTDLLRNPVFVYDFDDGGRHPLSVEAALHNYYTRISTSIRPFTLAHHLVTYCDQLNWSIGLMYHEFVDLPHRWRYPYSKMDDLIIKYSLF